MLLPFFDCGCVLLGGGVGLGSQAALAADIPQTRTTQPDVPAGIRILPDLAYLPPDRAEKLDLYLPADRPPALRSPAVVVIHGAGWVAGDKHDRRERAMATDLALAGYVCASINYRIGDGAWPTNLLDCKNAVRFLRVRAAEYGINPEHIAVMGGSAGGHLALMVGFTADVASLEPAAPYPGVSSRVTAVGDFYGPSDLVQRLDPSGEKPVVTRYDAGAAKVFGLTRDASPVAWRAVSPLGHIRDSAPPVLILHGRADKSVDYEQSLELARELERRGLAHELVIVEDGVGHSFDFQSTIQGKPLPRDLRPVIFGFLARYMPPPLQPLAGDSR
jgi:acetyl esterase/lipase